MEHYIRQLYTAARTPALAEQVPRVLRTDDLSAAQLEPLLSNLLYEVPMPPVGNSVLFHCLNPIVCYRPNTNVAHHARQPQLTALQELHLFEYSMSALLALLEPKSLLRLVSAVLLEQQIILLSAGIAVPPVRDVTAPQRTRG